MYLASPVLLNLKDYSNQESAKQNSLTILRVKVKRHDLRHIVKWIDPYCSSVCLVIELNHSALHDLWPMPMFHAREESSEP